MTLTETTDIILRWLDSCETQEQIDLTKDVFTRFVMDVFYKTEDILEYTASGVRFYEAVSLKEKMITVPCK